MKTYTKQDFHNPEKLTRQQVGDEYRLLLPDENHEDQNFIIGRGAWTKAGYPNASAAVTCRVPLETPLPDGTVLSSNECCWSDAKPSDPRKTVYCCGPMSNMPDYNFPAFYAACAKLDQQGYKTINPAQLDCDAGYPLERLKALTPDEFQVFLKGAMKRDLDALQQCDAIALLPGWENSKGARAEKAVAEWLGLEVMYLDGAEAPNEPEEAWEESRFEYGNTVQVNGALAASSHTYTSIYDGVGRNPCATYAPDDPKGAAGALKAPMWLLPPYALQQTAWVHKLGAAKYQPYNWRGTGVCATTYISAMMRHLDAWRDGEDNDPESGVSHIAHIAASCNIILDAQHCDKLRDDRPKLRQI